MAELTVNIDTFDRRFPYFAAPVVVGEFTVNENRGIELGRDNAKYLNHALLGKGGLKLNLNKGQDTFREKPSGEKLNIFLEWIRQQSPSGKNLKKTCHEADIITYRGVLTRVSVTPYKGDSWMFVAKRLKNRGVTFLHELQTADKIMKESTMSDRDRMMTYWGFKFEQYVTVDEMGTEPNTTEAVSQLSEFDAVFKSQIERDGRKLRLLYAAEIDAIDRDGDLVEVKTQRESFNHSFWRFKSISWWMQSFLVGIKNIVVGFRNDDGIVTSVGSIPVKQLPVGEQPPAKRAHGPQWKGNVCFNFLASVLEKMDDFLCYSDSRDSCIVEYIPSKQMVVYRDVTNGEDSFLSEAFKKHFNIE